jgi:hypothetical protein
LRRKRMSDDTVEATVKLNVKYLVTNTPENIATLRLVLDAGVRQFVGRGGLTGGTDFLVEAWDIEVDLNGQT